MYGRIVVIKAIQLSAAVVVRVVNISVFVSFKDSIPEG
jgi:hypothetical protein